MPDYNSRLTSNNAKLDKLVQDVNALPDAKAEQTKTIEITQNGDLTISPDVGKVLSSVLAKVNVKGADIAPYSGFRTGNFTLPTDMSSGRYEIEGTELASTSEKNSIFFIYSLEYALGTNTFADNVSLFGCMFEKQPDGYLFTHDPYAGFRAHMGLEWFGNIVIYTSKYAMLKGNTPYNWVILEWDK